MSKGSPGTNLVPQTARRIQFSLRTMLLTIVLLSLPLAWLAARLDRAMRQRSIVEGIRGIGGEVEYDDEFDRSGDQPGWRDPSGPKWLRKLLGHDFLSGVCVVVLANDRVTNGHLERISALKGLQWLSLQDASITDTGLEQLKGLDSTYFIGSRQHSGNGRWRWTAQRSEPTHNTESLWHSGNGRWRWTAEGSDSTSRIGSP